MDNWLTGLFKRLSVIGSEGAKAALLVVVVLMAVHYFEVNEHSTQAEILEVTLTVIFVLITTVLLASRHVLWLWSLQPQSSIWRLRRLRGIASNSQKELTKQFLELRARFVALLDSGKLENATYQEQMIFAQLFYSSHKQKVWATSLDPLSEFIRINEGYARTMAQKNEIASDQRNLAEADPPPLARIFILPADRFVEDIINDATAARDLIGLHLKNWHTFPRLLLVESRRTTVWSEMLTWLTQEPDAISISIPDFMLVDDRFIYGRVKPEVLDKKVPLLRSSFTLGFSEEARDTRAYRELFCELWRRSMPIDQFATQMLLAATSGPSSSPPDRCVGLGLAAVREYTGPTEEFDKFLHNTTEDIQDFFGDGERRIRYPDFFEPRRAGRPIGEIFRAAMSRAVGPCYAIDRADIKGGPVRFPTTWMTDKRYRPWRDAFAKTGPGLRRRIFVVRDWQFGNDEWLETFLMLEVVQNEIEVGIIHQDDLETFARGSRGVDAATHDSEWIIANADGTSGHPEAGPATLGLNLGAREVEGERSSDEEVKFGERDLILTSKLNAYLSWQDTIWTTTGDKLWRLSSGQMVHYFIDTIKARMGQEASPRLARVERKAN
jgi:hypothetical protein